MAPDGSVSKSEFARLRGVNPAMVTRWCRSGRLVMIGNRVDAEKSQALLAGALDPSMGGRRTGRPPQDRDDPVDPAPPTYNSVRTAREQSNAKLAELDYRERVGELIERKRYAKAIEDALAPIMSALDGLAPRLGPLVTGVTDPRKVQNLIDDQVDAIRRDMETTLRAMLAGPQGTRQ